MTRAEREAFLAATRVAVVSIVDPGNGPLTVPVWYAYEPGGVVRLVTGTRSRKAALLRAAGRMGLCVQDETPPYRYVSIEGPVRLVEVDFGRDVEAVALRYLGPEMGRRYVQMTEAERAAEPNVLVELTPERWRTVDYRKMMG
ncbi:MAG: pyridoxamine 5'-phosphate oxidase family protein [bacterium]|nr:pyridoxamine 5'-phosphate oxidase family protein [bacterium]